jgi:hypothetical protein
MSKIAEFGKKAQGILGIKLRLLIQTHMGLGCGQAPIHSKSVLDMTRVKKLHYCARGQFFCNCLFPSYKSMMA